MVPYYITMINTATGMFMYILVVYILRWLYPQMSAQQRINFSCFHLDDISNIFSQFNLIN